MKRRSIINKKEKKALSLQILTEQAHRKFIDRRDFMKATMALGLSATTALLLFQACGGDGPTPAPTTAGPATTAAPADPAVPATAVPATTAAEVPEVVATSAPAPTAVPPTPPPAEEIGQSLDHLVKRFPEVSELPPGKDLHTMWASLEGKSVFYDAIFLAHPFVQNNSDEFERHCLRLGMTYQVVDAAFDPAKEIEIADLAISRGFDVIYLHPTNPAGLSPNVKRAREDGRIVMNYDTDTFVRPTIKWGRGFAIDGYLAGKWLAERLPDGAKVVSGVGERITTAGNDRPRGLKQALDEAGRGLELIADEDGHGWTQEGGYDMARAMFQRFPQIDAMFGGDDQGALGFNRAAVDLGRRDQLLIAGVDGLREGQEAVRDGRLDVSTMFRRGHGPEAESCILFTAALLRGEVHGDLTQSMHLFKLLAVDKTTIDDQWQSTV